MPTTFTIDDTLQEVLDKIVDSDPRYQTRSELIRNWLWEKIKSLGYFDESKFGKEKDAALVEAIKPEAVPSEV